MLPGPPVIKFAKTGTDADGFTVPQEIIIMLPDGKSGNAYDSVPPASDPYFNTLTQLFGMKYYRVDGQIRNQSIASNFPAAIDGSCWYIQRTLPPADLMSVIYLGIDSKHQVTQAQPAPTHFRAKVTPCPPGVDCSEDHTGMIVGITLGSIGAVALIAIAVVLLKKRHDKKKQMREPARHAY